MTIFTLAIAAFLLLVGLGVGIVLGYALAASRRTSPEVGRDGAATAAADDAQ